MTDKAKTLSRAYAYQGKIYTPHSANVPDALLKRDAEWLAAKAARQAEEGDAGGDDADGGNAESAAPRRASKKTAKKK
jgi:hypothetical protein